jgi:hypothetical protein
MDKLILEKALESVSEDTSPFLSREMIKLKDQAAAGNYSSQTSVFETITLSNGGKWCDYTEAYLTIPLVCVMSGEGLDANGDTYAIDFTAAHIKDSDFALGFKNSNLNLINSCAIEYGNRSLVQATDYINDYLIFKQHSEMSEMDEAVHGPTIGYAKDNSKSWYYEAYNGVCNNNNPGFVDNPLCNVEVANDGLRKRQESFRNINNRVGHGSIYGDSAALKKNNGTYIENHTTYKAYYTTAIIRLKDLPVFRDCPALMKGANFKITLTLNQCVFEFTKTANALRFKPSSFNGKQTNPLMVTASQVVTQFASSTDEESSSTSMASGTWTLPNDCTYTVSCNVGRVNYTNHSSLSPTPSPQESNIELHVPIYDLKPDSEKRLLAQGQKRVVYNEILSFVQTGKLGTFNELITNGISHLKRMIILPIMSSDGNGTLSVSPHASPFDTVPATCSPYMIENFQVQVANHNIYHTPLNYSYESFLSELNGKYGLDSSIENGISSSRINLQDYVNTYGYMVVDLKRKNSEDESVPLSVQMSGRITSLKKLDFYIFIETEKSFTFDVASGQRLS